MNVRGVLQEMRRDAAAIVATLVCAASFAAPPRSLTFEHLGVQQGLPQATSVPIVQDRRGYIWIGSQGGLSRFDGYRVTVYRHDDADPRSLADNDIQSMYVDGQGTLWVGTFGGLDRYDHTVDGFVHHGHAESGRTIVGRPNLYAITGDGQQGLWLGTDHGLQHFDRASGRMTAYRHEQDKPSTLVGDDVRTLALDRDGNLWIGTTGGLDFLRRGSDRFEHLEVNPRVAPDAKGNVVQALYFDRAGTLWIGTEADLHAWRKVDGLLERRRWGKEEGFPDDGTRSILQDADGAMWFGSTKGLLTLDVATNRFHAYRHVIGDPDSIAAERAEMLFQDRGGTLWVGTWSSGTSRVDLSSGGFSRWQANADDPDTLSTNDTEGIAEDPDGHLWIATHSGLNRLDPSSGKVMRFGRAQGEVASVREARIWSVHVDSKGTLRTGSMEGLNEVDRKTGRIVGNRLFERGETQSNWIRRINEDRAGTLWLSSYGGLHRLDPKSGTVKTYHQDARDPGSLASDYVFKVLEDKDGHLWVATLSGLDMLDRSTDRFIHFRHDPSDPTSLGYDVIYDLLEDSKGTLWVLTKNGLNRKEVRDGKVRFQVFPSAMAINSVLEGQGGQLWVGTDDSLAAFDPQTGTYRYRRHADGLPHGGFTDANAWRARDGTLYFGSIHGGVVGFRPEKLRDNASPPQVVITDFLLFNRSVRGAHGGQDGFAPIRSLEIPATLNLSYRHSVFSIEFAALHYADPASNRYAYQLQGFDQDWVITNANNRLATYTNLDPGRYVFRVKAANKDGVWNEQGASLTIDIEPPFWRTWWFRMLSGSAIALTAWAAYRARIRRLVVQRKELEGQVAARTEEAVKQKTFAEDALTELRRTQQQLVLNDKMASVGTLTAGVAHEINNPANFALVSAQALSDGLNRFRDFLLSLADDDSGEVAAAVNCRVDELVSQVGTIVEGTSRIRDLVRDLRTFSRLGEADIQVAAVGASLLSTVHLVRAQFALTADIRCDLQADPPLNCWPAQLNQVFMNIIVNACQAIAEKQRLTGDMRPGSLDIRSRIVDRWLELEFEDNGGGMPPEIVDRIFEPFFTTKPVGLGTGLGLSISFGIVARHGGEIRVRSTQGAGTCVMVRLPLMPEQRSAEVTHSDGK